MRGFLSAASKEDKQAASAYLETPRKGEDTASLVDQLSVVLNRGLHLQLNDISDRPEGSLLYSAEPNKDLVGRVTSDSGEVDIVVERIERKDVGPIWLFSGQTLDAVPELYAEISANNQQNGLLKFLLETKIAHIALLHWVAVFIGLPLLYLFGIGLNRLLSPLAGRLIRALNKNPKLPNPEVVSKPVWLLLVALVIRLMLSKVPLPLLAREFWSGIAVAIAIAGCAWLVMRLSRWFEDKISLRLGRRNLTGALSVLRFVRSGVDALIVFVGLLVLLRYFGIKASTALAGLGIGGIAIALAAQKTLENVIAGVSLISDKALRVGDFLRVGTTMGTVTAIGLRSTRIRTLDRTLVNLPNGQIANASLENLSLRDQFWFHHILGLTYETSAAQLRAVLSGIIDLLTRRPEVAKEAGQHVRLLRFGASSFEIEIFAYVFARDWPQFLGIQEGLLLQILEVVEKADTRIALPSQITYLNTDLSRTANLNDHLKSSAR